MEKSYDLTWRHGILMDTNEAWIGGRVFYFMQNFLKPRLFKVKDNENLADTKVQTEGIPQGSVASRTFSYKKKNKVVSHMPKDNIYQISLYMKDLQISYRYPNWRVVERKLQDSINIFEKFAQKNGSKFSTRKTSMLRFIKLSVPPPIERTSTRQH